MAENPERHYNINLLNILFALASLVLLGSLVFMFADDYSREWRGHQRKFKELEAEKTRAKYSAEVKELNEQEQYRDLQKQFEQIKAEQKTKKENMAGLEKDIGKLRAKFDVANQRYQFAKAKYDALRYQYEEAANQQKSETGALKKEFDKISQETASLKAATESINSSIEEKNRIILEHTSALRETEKNLKALTKQADLLDRKLKKIDPKSMSTANKIASAVRDLPILDLANPNYRVQQIVLSDLTDNVNFMRVPKVDRCITCHVGITNPDFKDAPQPFRTHPNLELFVGNNSAHPMEEFGCTVCHGGRGRGTDFVSSVHTPSSEEQAAEWEKKYHWHRYHLWEKPMLPKPFVQASCLQCHSGETAVKGAEKLNVGLNLIERAGCFGCHTIEKYKDWPKTGPDLAHLASKTTSQWAYLWIKDPKSFRHNTWMPSFFGQSNNSDAESVKRTDQEIHAMVHFLFKGSTKFPMAEIPVNGDLKKGEQLVASLGCFGCHQIQPQPVEEKLSRERLSREHGPNLIGLGTKTSKAWLYNWLKDPRRYHPDTKMPDLRLSDQEAADIASFLASNQEREFIKTAIPTVDEALIGQIAEEFLSKSVSLADARAQIAKMSTDEKLMFTGKKLIRHYGCYACHNIPGFETEKPIGTDLTEEGGKPAEKLDFGFSKIERTNYAWFAQKLKDPRIFDHGYVKAPDEKLRMPDYHFTDEEIEAITTALLGFVNDAPGTTKLPPADPQRVFVQEGQKIVRQFNCQGCHIMEGEGGYIQPAVTQWLIKYQGKDENEAKAVTQSFSPPNLIGEGKKVQAEWLFEFLHEPTTIRPWLSVRMPTFHFNAAQLNTLVKYFNYLDNEEFPFSEVVDTSMTPQELEAAHKLFSKDYFDCASCHIVGNQMPSGSPDRWAPDFALAHSRLKPNWIVHWISDPQALLPGTKMPTYFDPKYFDASGPDDVLGGDEHKQIQILRSYIMSIGDPKAVGKPVPVEPVTPVVPPEPVAPEAPAESSGTPGQMSAAETNPSSSAQ